MNENEAKKLAFAKLMYDWSKAVLEKPKPEFRAGKVVKKNDYLDVTTSDYPNSKFPAEAQAKIDKFIKDNKLEKEKVVIPNYKVIYTAKAKAKEEFLEMLDKYHIEV